MLIVGCKLPHRCRKSSLLSGYPCERCQWQVHSPRNQTMEEGRRQTLVPSRHCSSSRQCQPLPLYDGIASDLSFCAKSGDSQPAIQSSRNQSTRQSTQTESGINFLSTKQETGPRQEVTQVSTTKATIPKRVDYLGDTPGQAGEAELNQRRNVHQRRK